MLKTLLNVNLSGLFRREQDTSMKSRVRTLLESGTQDLRSSDHSAARDRSAHRRSAWLYEDLLN